MEPKRLILTIGVCILLVVVWTWGTAKFAEWQGWDLNKRAETEQTDPDAQVADPGIGDDLPAPGIVEAPAVSGEEGDTDTPATQSSTEPANDTAATGQLRVVEQGTPQVLPLGSSVAEDPTFSIGIAVNTRGAGVDQIILNSYAQTVHSDDRYTFQQPYTISPDATRPLATRSVQLLGQTVRLDDVVWKVDTANTDHRQALLYVDLADANGPLVRVKKFIKVYEKEEQIGGETFEHGGYEIRVSQSLKNLRVKPLTARMTLVGPNGPPSDLEQGYDRYVVLGRTGKNGVEYDPVSVDNFDGDDATETFAIRDNEDGDLVWAGQGSIYFNAILRPTKETTPRLAQVVGEAIDAEATFKEVTTRFVTEPLELAGGQETSIQFAGYFGPKSGLLENDYYGQSAIDYDRTLVSPFGCTWCVFQPVVDLLKLLLNVFHFLLRDWGMAIIGLVLIVRLLLHPITKKSQKNMLRMQKLAPKMEEIKKKYGDDKEKMAAATAELMPEQASAMLMGCLPMVLQTPIWIALYSMLQAQFDLRQAEPFYGLTWIDDLSKPDHLLEFAPFSVFFFTISGLNLLPILLGIVFYVNIKLQPQPTVAMSDEQKQQQKIMQVIMVGMFPIFLYSAPSGLNLYIITSTVWGILETKIIRKQVKAQEEWEKANPELVAEREKSKPQSGWRARMGKFQEELQKRVEDAQKQQGQTKGKKPDKK